MSMITVTRYLIESLVQSVTDIPMFWEPPFAFIRVAAYRSLGAKIANGAIIQQRVRIRSFRNLTLEKDSYLSFDVRVHAEAAVSILEGTIIGPGVGIFTGDHSLHDLSPRAAPVTIGPRCFVGARAIILGGVTIGADAMVGAGALVADDIPERAIAVGIPAKVVGFREHIGATYWTINGFRSLVRKQSSAIDKFIGP